MFYFFSNRPGVLDDLPQLPDWNPWLVGSVEKTRTKGLTRGMLTFSEVSIRLHRPSVMVHTC